jgi:CSLREA domain-containing protein
MLYWQGGFMKISTLRSHAAQITAAALILVLPQFASAATFTVNSTADVADKNTGDGECDTGNVVVINGERKPECTLRAAIMETNMNLAGPVPDTIILPALAAGPYRLRSGELNIVQSLNILGSGSADTIIDGELSNSRVFHISCTTPSGAPTECVRLRGRPTVQISGATIQNGGGEIGGAILIEIGARLVLRNTIITESSAARGGGISNAGDLFIFDSTISDNVAANQGGGIANSGRLTIRASTIDGNESGTTSTEGGGGGGGIVNSGGTVTIEESTISNNHQREKGDGGGGIFNDGGVLEIDNSTISSNTQVSGAAQGGGIYNNLGQVSLFNVTITNNKAGFSDPIQVGFGGGGIASESGGFVFLANTIVAGNFSNIAGTFPNDCAGTLDSRGFNLLGTTANPNLPGIGACDFRNTPGDQDQIGISLQALRLGPLQRNGGLTKTHALLPGSPAINKGNQATPGGGFTCLPRDQRVLRRLDRCDIGAFEFGAINITGTTSMLRETREETSDPTPIPPSPAFPNGFPGGTVTFTLTFTNVGNVSIRNLVFEVTELSVKEIGSDFSLGGLLLNADAFRGRRGIGAIISAPPNRVLSPGGVPITQNFIVGRQTPNDSFNFAIDVLGVPLSR